MKYILFLLISICLCSCGRERQQEYVKVVHNPCNNKWAVETGFGVSDLEDADKKPFTKLYYGLYTHSDYHGVIVFDGCKYREPDTISNAVLGMEFQFPDSTSAIKSYLEHIVEPLRKRDSTRRAKDSIYKCNHTFE